jgi:hypothetical protein
MGAREFLSKFNSTTDLRALELDERSKVLYTISMSYCAATDLTKERDQKTPGTFFEILVGHIFSLLYNVEPKKEIDVLNLDTQQALPTDYIFDMGVNKSKLSYLLANGSCRYGPTSVF